MNTFSTITFRFFVRKFFETKKVFKKIMKKFQLLPLKSEKFLSAAVDSEKEATNYLAATTERQKN